MRRRLLAACAAVMLALGAGTLATACERQATTDQPEAPAETGPTDEPTSLETTVTGNPGTTDQPTDDETTSPED
jgi:hypothetical protein